MIRGGFLAPAILCAALGLALAFLPIRRAMVAASLVALVAVAVSSLEISDAWVEPIYVGCWVSVLASAALLYNPQRAPAALFLAAAANVGLWAGAVTAAGNRQMDLAIALPLLLVMFPGRAIVAKGWSIALEVLASWLTAVAILATMVSLTPTPGYAPDHME